MPPLAMLAGKRVLFAMAADAEYGPHLKAIFTPLMTGVGPVEASISLTPGKSGTDGFYFAALTRV